MRPRRRVIVEHTPARPDPELPDGMAIIDRRTVSRPACAPGEVAGQVVELLVAGDALPEAAELCEPFRVSVADLGLFAAVHEVRQ